MGYIKDRMDSSYVFGLPLRVVGSETLLVNIIYLLPCTFQQVLDYIWKLHFSDCHFQKWKLTKMAEYRI